MNHHVQLRQVQGRLDKKLLQFSGALIVPPVADPNHVNLFAMLERMKLLNVSGFMKSPCPVYAKTIDVYTPDGLAKREHAIHQVQMEFQNLPGAGVSAMMAVMEQRDETEFLLQGEHLVHHLRIIPFVQQDDVGLFQLFFQKAGELVVTGLIESDIEFRIGAAERINGLNGALTFLLHQVGKRP